MSEAREYARGLGQAGAGESPDVPPPLERIVEALLFAGGQPLTAELAAHTIRGLAPDQFRGVIDELNRQYRREGRPFTVREQAAGWALELKSAFAGLRERLTGGPRAARLSVAHLDVLAIVAYKQPVTRSEMDAIRGAESATLVRQLIRLGLVAVQDNVPGFEEPAFNTTARFLELFGLRSLDELPRTSDLQKI